MAILLNMNFKGFLKVSFDKFPKPDQSTSTFSENLRISEPAKGFIIFIIKRQIFIIKRQINQSINQPKGSSFC